MLTCPHTFGDIAPPPRAANSSSSSSSSSSTTGLRHQNPARRVEFCGSHLLCHMCKSLINGVCSSTSWKMGLLPVINAGEQRESGWPLFRRPNHLKNPETNYHLCSEHWSCVGILLNLIIRFLLAKSPRTFQYQMTSVHSIKVELLSIMFHSPIVWY